MKNTKLLKNLFVLLLVAVSAFAFTACTSNEKKAETEALTYVTFRINPEVGLLLDSNEEVVDTIALNDDADTLLADVDLTGKTVEEASDTIVGEAVEAGFLDPQDDEKIIYVDVTNADEAEENETIENLNKDLYEKVKKNIEKFCVENGILAKTTMEDLSEYIDKAMELGVTEKKAKLIEITLDLNPEMDETELASMSEKELLALCHKAANGKVNHALNEMFKENVKTIRDANESLSSINARILEIKERLEVLYKELDNLNASLEQLNNDLLTAGEEEAKVIQLKIEEIKISIEEKQAEIDALEAELNELRGNYRDEFNTVKDEFKDAAKKAKEEIMKKADEKKAENEAKKADKVEKTKKTLEEYVEYFNNHKQEIEDQIRDGFESAEQNDNNDPEVGEEGDITIENIFQKIRDLKEKLETLYQDLHRLNATLVQLQADLLVATEEDIEIINTKINEVTLAIEEKQAEINDLEAEIRALIEDYRNGYNNQIGKIHGQLQDIINGLKGNK